MSALAGRLDERPLDGPIPRWEIAPWREQHGIVAGITGRGHDFNLGLLTGAPAAHVVEGWRSLAAAFAPQFTTLVAGLQVHGVRIATHDDLPPGWLIVDGVDGHTTRSPGVLLAVTVADCVPVYLAHPASGTVALLHAGWRGIAAGILEAGIKRLCEAANVPEGELVMHCGVAICGPCYEVGAEVRAAVTGRPGSPGPLDLRPMLADRARARGVEAVTASGFCAGHDGGRFFSHRRSGGRDGRMVAFLGLPRA